LLVSLLHPILPPSVNICKHFVIQTIEQFTSWSLSGFKEQEIAYRNSCDFAWHALCSIARILKSCRRYVGQVSAVGNHSFSLPWLWKVFLDLFLWRDSP